MLNNKTQLKKPACLATNMDTQSWQQRAHWSKGGYAVTLKGRFNVVASLQKGIVLFTELHSRRRLHVSQTSCMQDKSGLCLY